MASRTSISKQTGEADNGAAATAPQQRWTDQLTDHERQALAKRTRLLACEEEHQIDIREYIPFIRFHLGSLEHYGIPYQAVAEILYFQGIAEIPCTPDFVAGVINRRGELLTVLDLNRFFKTDHVTYSDNARIIIVNGSGLTLGLIVDDVIGIDTYDAQRLSPPLPSSGVSNIQYVKGIHHGEVTILDMEEILADPALRIDEHGA